MLRRLFRQQGLLQVRERSGVLLALAPALVLALALAGLVLTACPILLRVAIRLSGRPGGSARWLPEESLPSQNQPPGMLEDGCSGDARLAPPHAPARRRHRRAGLGILRDQAESSPDEGPEQRAHDHQMLAATAKRSVHRASKLEHNHHNLAKARRGQTSGA